MDFDGKGDNSQSMFLSIGGNPESEASTSGLGMPNKTLKI